jgi:hypothetical protein
LEDDTQIDNRYFIKDTLLGFGIFLNTPDGIVRYTPIAYSKYFFNLIFDINDPNFKIDDTHKYYCADI